MDTRGGDGLAEVERRTHPDVVEPVRQDQAGRHVATWDGRTWIYDDALSKLKSGYEGFGGSGYYAKCN